MDTDRNEITKRILNFTLEIIYLLTGEDYTISKKTSGDCVTLSGHVHESGGRSRSHSPITEPPPHSPIHEQKILELTNKITELLTGEVPIRCQDVTLYFSMEEWEYLEGHKDLYKDIMMENYQPITSQENPNKSSEENVISSLNCKVEGENIMELYSEENVKTLNFPTESFNPPNHQEPSPDQSQIVTTSTEHKGCDRFQCGECGEEFTKNSHLSMHRKTHKRKKPHSCSECGKCFISISKLVSHQRIHTGEKPYSCSECGKCFTDKSTFVRHWRTHTGERPFICSECGKGFIEKSKLTVHERNHTGEKPFPCSECGKCFIEKSRLVAHVRIHTRGNPFSCSGCGKDFIDMPTYVRHQRIHTGEETLLI